MVPSWARVMIGISATSMPRPAIDDAVQRDCSLVVTSTRRATTIVATTTTSGASACQSMWGLWKPEAEASRDASTISYRCG
ncbi:MAG: hypothetical protein U0P45_16520 [Acidimicrobiales bacterium]